MKLSLAQIKKDGSVIEFNPKLNIYRNIYINNRGPSFTVHVNELNMTVISDISFEDASDRLIKELFKLWEIATTQFSSKDPRVIKIRELGVEMPADFLKKDA